MRVGKSGAQLERQSDVAGIARGNTVARWVRLVFRRLGAAGFSFDDFQSAHQFDHDIDRISVRVYADTAQAIVFEDFEQKIFFFR